jgi:hypothetical protein
MGQARANARHARESHHRAIHRSPLPKHFRSSQTKETGTMPFEPIPEDSENGSEEHAGNSLDTILNGSVFSYNLDDSKTPGGLKVRFKVRVVTGPEAGRYDVRQAEAIREILLWARRHPDRLTRRPQP